MQYPLISDYKTAVLKPETFDKFQHLKPVTDSFGQPIFATGGVAVVFKMYDPSTNKKFALKCFLKHQNNRKEHFDAVGYYLEQIHSPYLCNYEYLEDEICINESTFPVLAMDWIEGEMMSLRVAELCEKGDHEALSLLAGKFDALGLWLMQCDLAHCDITPDNVLITPKGDLKLVDYDGMYVPELKGKRSPELGTAEYRHPKRTPDDFGPQLDDFPILVLSLSLHSLAKDPSLYDSTINGDALMFRSEDYTSLLACRYLSFFIINQSSAVISSRLGLLLYSLHQEFIDLKGLQEVLEKTAYIPTPLTTKVEPEDGEWIDEFGVKYSADRRKLIKCDSSYKGEYIVREGTEVICDYAFSDCDGLASLILPDSISSIGLSAFSYCSSLPRLVLPKGILKISNCTFLGCSGLKSLVLPSGITSIGYSAFACCSGLQSLVLPENVTSLDNYAFFNCHSLLRIILPKGITSLERGTFENCNSLSSVILPAGLLFIGHSAFAGCNGLSKIVLPDGIFYIGDNVFWKCSKLSNLVLPNELTILGVNAFGQCSNLKSIVIPSSVSRLPDRVFYGCSSLTSIKLPSAITDIGDLTFGDCFSLISIIIPMGANTLRTLLIDRNIMKSKIREVVFP